MKHAPVLLVLVLALAGCSPGQEGTGSGPQGADAPADMHNSRNSLDWAGTYEGVLPCADCPGIQTTLTLASDGTFENLSQYLDRDAGPRTERGRFSWRPDGNAIALGADGGAPVFAVGEGRLTLLNSDGSRPDGAAANRVLLKVGADAGPADAGQVGGGAGLNPFLENHRWVLDSATDGKGQRIDALFPAPDRAFAFSFAQSGLSVQGGCNSFRGRYEVDAGGQFRAGQLAGTMMACEPALMTADTTLMALLAQPLRVETVEGAQPQLRLQTAANETLVLQGQLTPEALYGPGAIMFLEVNAEQVACQNPFTQATRCLQVRERRFDEQGLRVGTPGEWQPFYPPIEGYEHTAGVRNVIRVKRFDRSPAPADAPPAVYVLDLIVESETVQ